MGKSVFCRFRRKFNIAYRNNQHSLELLDGKSLSADENDPV